MPTLNKLSKIIKRHVDKNSAKPVKSDAQAPSELRQEAFSIRDMLAHHPSCVYLSYHIAKDLPEYVWGNRQGIDNILFALLDHEYEGIGDGDIGLEVLVGRLENKKVWVQFVFTPQFNPEMVRRIVDIMRGSIDGCTITIPLLAANPVEKMDCQFEKGKRVVSDDIKALAVIDLEDGAALAGGNEQHAVEMIRVLESRLPAELEQLQSLCQDRAYDMMYELVHKLFGGLCYCGVPQLRSVTKYLKRALHEKNEVEIQQGMESFAEAIQQLSDQVKQLG